MTTTKDAANGSATAAPVVGLALLREPFPPNQVGKLPKQVRRDDQDKGKCEPGSRYSADGHVCGGWHARSIHLDYVGHAAITDRLLNADPEWGWEPVAFGPDGLPALDKNGGLWIKLTVCGVTRFGYGDAQGKTGNNAIKEAIGDALRNAGMRFGAGLDLWHKGDLRADAVESVDSSAPPSAATAAPPSDEPDFSALDAQRFEELIDGATTAAELQAIAADIAASSISGPPRDQLRQKFSAKSKQVTG